MQKHDDYLIPLLALVGSYILMGLIYPILFEHVFDWFLLVFFMYVVVLFIIKSIMRFVIKTYSKISQRTVGESVGNLVKTVGNGVSETAEFFGSILRFALGIIIILFFINLYGLIDLPIDWLLNYRIMGIIGVIIMVILFFNGDLW